MSLLTETKGNPFSCGDNCDTHRPPRKGCVQPMDEIYGKIPSNVISVENIHVNRNGIKLLVEFEGVKEPCWVEHFHILQFTGARQAIADHIEALAFHHGKHFVRKMTLAKWNRHFFLQVLGPSHWAMFPKVKQFKFIPVNLKYSSN